MTKTMRFTLIAVGTLFILSMLLKANSAPADRAPLVHGFLITCAAFLTLSIMSFLYQDNPFYKFAEHLFVGVSAAFWMCLGFWSTIVGNLIPRISHSLSDYFGVPYQGGGFESYTYYLPLVLSVLLLMRLSSKYGWISRWPLAFIIGTTAGLNFIRYLRSDFIEQISATFMPLVINWHGFGDFFAHFSLQAGGQFALMLTNWVVFAGVFSGVIYFFFSKEHSGWFGRVSQFGIWIMMITFGASFGYTVMGRISLLIGRVTFLFRDWLGLIN